MRSAARTQKRTHVTANFCFDGVRLLCRTLRNFAPSRPNFAGGSAYERLILRAQAANPWFTRDSSRFWPPQRSCNTGDSRHRHADAPPPLSTSPFGSDGFQACGFRPVGESSGRQVQAAMAAALKSAARVARGKGAEQSAPFAIGAASRRSQPRGARPAPGVFPAALRAARTGD